MRDEEKERVVIIAKAMCVNTDALDHGGKPIQPWMDEEVFRSGGYEYIFKRGVYKPDGVHRGHDCTYSWRRYIFKAQKVLKALDAVG